MRGLIIFLIGAAAGAGALYYCQHRQAESVSNPIAVWHLTPDDIRADLARTGEVARSRLQEAGGRIDDARIVALIKAKLVLDSDLSAFDIRVSSRDGTVRLTGTVSSPALVGRAVALALNTDGVRSVVARLEVR